MRTTIRAILNPKAGTYRKKDSLPDLLKTVFNEMKSPYERFEIVKSTGPGHATDLAKQAAYQGVGLCIAIGGDGTMNETATGLLHSETTLGIIPIGSGNGMARHLGLSMEPEIAFRQLLTGNSVLMDSGIANQKPYFLSAGIGFEGMVSHAFATQKSRGLQQYILSSVRAFQKYKPVDIEWETNIGFGLGKIFTMTIANGAQYGNNAFIAPGASIRDGLLELVVVRPFPFFLGPGFIWKLMRHSLKNSNHYQVSRIKSIRIQSHEQLLGHLDGEPIDFEYLLEISIKPKSLRIQVPIGKEWF